MLRRRFASRLHDFRVAGIERTPPLPARPTGIMYAGMTSHRDTRSWLVAVKSIAASVGAGEFTVIDDGSLTARDRDLLARHLPGLRVVSLRDVATDGFPRGGCWERLLTILDLSRDFYVLQVDADLVARMPLTEVAAAVQANRAFTLAGERTSQLMSLADSSEQARRVNDSHVQIAAEQLLFEFPGGGGLRYVRGCAGFAGFPKGCNRALVAPFSQFMQSRLGERWQQWGTEQIASNFVIANTNDPVVLPWDRYPAFGLEPDVSRAALVHFIGFNRYGDGVFTHASRAAIKRLEGINRSIA